MNPNQIEPPDELLSKVKSTGAGCPYFTLSITTVYSRSVITCDITKLLLPLDTGALHKCLEVYFGSTRVLMCVMWFVIIWGSFILRGTAGAV